MTPEVESEVPKGYVDNLFDIPVRVAVVTGGGSGLGAAIWVGFAQAGARVVVADISDDGATHNGKVIESEAAMPALFTLTSSTAPRWRLPRTMSFATLAR